MSYRDYLGWTRGVTVLVSAMLLVSACTKNNDTVTPSGGTTSGTATTGTGTSVRINDVATTSTAPEGSTAVAYIEDDLIEKSSFTATVSIQFGTTVSITNPLASSGVTITQSNGDVIVKSTATGVAFDLSGTTTSGSVKIYSDKKFKLTLNTLNITNNDGPAINIQSGKRAFLVLNGASSLTDAATYAASGTEDQKATLFSEGQLIVSGTGTLNVKGNYKHAICSDEYVRLMSGTINVSGAPSDGIHTNDAFIADGGTVNIVTAGDGIQVEEGYVVINNGTFNISVADKGLSAVWDTDATIDPYLTINGGTFNITSSAGEGIESKSVLTINNGTFNIKTADDGINAGKFIYINGGTLYVYSTSNDGIDSNGKLTVTGGKTVSVGAAAPEEGFDCDRNTFRITGGIMVGIGGATSTPTANTCTQPSVLLGKGTLNQLMHIEANDGTEALTFLVPRAYTTMLFSSPKLKVGQSYKVYTGGSVADGNVATGGLYSSGTYTLGTQASTFTTTTMVTNAGGSGGR